MNDKKKISLVLRNMEDLESVSVELAKKALEKKIKPLGLEVISFEMKKGLLWNIILKLKKPFSLPHHSTTRFGFLVGDNFYLNNFISRYESGDYHPYRDLASKKWGDDLYFVLDTWMVEHGSFLQDVLGETPKYPLENQKIRMVKRRLQRYGKMGHLLLKAGVKVFGAAFFHLNLKILGEKDNFLWDSAMGDLARIKRTGSSQASWSILSSGVSQARVEAHIIRLTINQLLNSLEKSPLKEEVYKHIGDNLEALPAHLSKMERNLDRTNYALITMGGDWYRQRLVHEDREMVELASKFNPMPIPSKIKEASFSKEAGWTDGFAVFWDKLTNSTTRYVEAIEDLKKGNYSESQKERLGKKFKNRLESYKKALFKKSEEALRSDLKNYNLFLKKFDPEDLGKTTIVNKNNRKFTLKSLVKWAENKAELELPLPHPDPQYEDLIFTLKEWDYFYGSKLKVISGDMPIDKAKAEYTLLKNLSQFTNLGATKLRLLVEAVFEFLDASVIGVLIVIIQSKDTIIGYFSPAFFISLLVTWMFSLLIVGWHRSKPNFKRFQRIGHELI